MDYKKYKLFLVPLILVIMVLVSMSLMILFQFRTVEQLSHLPLERLAFGLIHTLLSVLFFNYSVRWLNKKVPWKRNWLYRAALDFVLAMLMPLVSISYVTYATQMGWIQAHGNGEDVRIFLFIMPLITSTMFLVIVEMIISVEEQGNLEVRLAQIEKEQINTKYGALKEQLDHHFLFNNLSVLSSLIYEDVEKADHFIQDFSSIYRYVLRINQRKLVTVKEELEFIDNYLHLYKFRYEKGFDYKVSVSETYMNHLIPPLTLQVLVENAIKHNVVSCKRPLALYIENKDAKLYVRNTLQEKETKEESTQTGQNNLVEKYKLLEYAPPVFKEEGNEYIVTLPLIAPHDN